MRMIDDMKKTIKKKKAFTLVELMGVLVIIGVLSAILIPVISNVLKENKEKAYQGQLQNIVLSAKNFVSDNMFLMPETEGDSISLTLGQLKKSGYAEKSIINPKTKQEISNCLQIEVKKANNNFDYLIKENTIEVDNCNEDYISDILISGPSKTYIKKDEMSSYILIISPSNEEQVLSYAFDDSKLSLGENTDAKYSVIGENGIYKIIIKAGQKEDDIYLTFEESAITDNVGNNIDMSTVAHEKIIVDNTPPAITFTNNGSGWTKNAKTKINVNDAKSGGSSSTYKYIFSQVTSVEPTNSFTIDKEVSHTSGNGEYYLIAKACDNVGNCKTEISNSFNMDTEAPSVPIVNLVYADNNQSYNQSWTTRNVKQIQSSSDAGIGGIYYQYGHDNLGWTNMENNWVISWDGSWTFFVRACDSLGNCSNSAPSYWIGIDKTPPEISCKWVDAVYAQNVFGLGCTGKDNGVGGVKRKAGWCYTNISGSSSCSYNSLDSRFTASGWVGLNSPVGYDYIDYLGFNSNPSLSVQVQYKDELGNATCIMLGERTSSNNGTSISCK